jgi:hypothetical protein
MPNVGGAKGMRLLCTCWFLVQEFQCLHDDDANEDVSFNVIS